MKEEKNEERNEWHRFIRKTSDINSEVVLKRAIVGSSDVLLQERQAEIDRDRKQKADDHFPFETISLSPKVKCRGSSGGQDYGKPAGLTADHGPKQL